MRLLCVINSNELVDVEVVNPIYLGRVYLVDAGKTECSSVSTRVKEIGIADDHTNTTIIKSCVRYHRSSSGYRSKM